MGGGWSQGPISRNPERGPPPTPGKASWGGNSQGGLGSPGEPWAELRAAPVTTRWELREGELSSGVQASRSECRTTMEGGQHFLENQMQRMAVLESALRQGCQGR